MRGDKEGFSEEDYRTPAICGNAGVNVVPSGLTKQSLHLLKRIKQALRKYNT